MHNNINDSPGEAEQLQQILEILGKFAGTIAHDVRNPLGTINTSLFSIRSAIKKNQPERIERALDIAERSIKKCDTVLGEFLNYTKNTSQKYSPVNIDHFLKTQLEEQAIPENIERVLDLNCDYTVSADVDQLKWAMANIIKNAIQAMKEKNSPDKQLTLHTSIAEGFPVISVEDNGIGIPDDVYEKIYEPFFSTKHFGVGLGLTVARKIVEAHNGTIHIESERGTGTKVTLKLPAEPSK